MPLAVAQLGLSLQVALAVVPVALYFLVLGLLNSQRRPQVLSARLDFVLLVSTMSPLVAVPVLSWLGAGAWTVVLSVAAVAAGIALLAPRARSGWVLYNIALPQARQAVEDALRDAALPVRPQAGLFLLGQDVSIRVSAFPLLRNVSLSVQGQPRHMARALRQFEQALIARAGGFEALPSPTAAAFVLVATAVVIAPLVLLADQMHEMVRIITDLIG